MSDKDFWKNIYAKLLAESKDMTIDELTEMFKQIDDKLDSQMNPNFIKYRKQKEEEHRKYIEEKYKRIDRYSKERQLYEEWNLIMTKLLYNPTLTQEEKSLLANQEKEKREEFFKLMIQGIKDFSEEQIVSRFDEIDLLYRFVRRMELEKINTDQSEEVMSK